VFAKVAKDQMGEGKKRCRVPRSHQAQVKIFMTVFFLLCTVCAPSTVCGRILSLAFVITT
jgi:hypothetical protein